MSDNDIIPSDSADDERIDMTLQSESHGNGEVVVGTNKITNSATTNDNDLSSSSNSNVANSNV